MDLFHIKLRLRVSESHSVRYKSTALNAYTLKIKWQWWPNSTESHYWLHSNCFNFTLIGPLQLGSKTTFFLENFYIIGYNLKNARNGKSTSKIPKWPSLRPLALKRKFVRQLEFSENLEDSYRKCCWRARPCSPTTFSIQIFLFF